MTTTEPDVKTWACPDSKLILSADAPRSEWLAARKIGLGGSDAAALMGDNPYDDGTPYFVWQDKINPEASEDRANKAMERGAAMEPIVRGLFESRTGLKTRRQGLHQSRTNPLMVASVDALEESGGGVELKTATTWAQSKWPEGWQDSGVPLYNWQAKHYMKVTGRRHWYVAALVIDTWELYVWKIDRDEDELELLEVVETEFWRTYVETGIAPDIDWDNYTSDEIRARFPTVTGEVLKLGAESQQAHDLRELILDRRAIDAEMKEAEAEKDRINDRIRVIAGGYAEVQIDGRKALTLKEQTTRRVTKDAIAEAYPDVDIERCKSASTSRVLRLDGKIFR